MTEVGIHLEDIVVGMFQRPFEAHDIRSTQPLLPAAFQKEQTVGKLLRHQSFHDSCRTVGRTIVNNQYMETLGFAFVRHDSAICASTVALAVPSVFQTEYGPDNLLDVLLLVIRRNDDNTVACVHDYL